MQEMTFPGFNFQKFSGGVLPQTPPIHVRYIGHTRGLQPLLSPSNILSHRKVPFQKMPPTGKSLKKALCWQVDCSKYNRKMYCIFSNKIFMMFSFIVFSVDSTLKGKVRRV